MQTISDIDDLTERLIPLTFFRRNAGEVLAKLQEMGELVVTRDGKPIARLSSIQDTTRQKKNIEADLEKLKRFAGGLHLGIKMSPKQLNKLIEKSYEKMLPR